MEDENDGLHSIERSRLRGVGSSQGRRLTTGNPRSSSQTSNVKKRRPSVEGRVRSPRADGSARIPRRRKKGITRYLVVSIIFLLIALALISTTFSNAKIDVILASSEVTIDGVFKAIREPGQSADISFNPRSTSPIKKEEIITNFTRERQNVRASGILTVYNTSEVQETLDLVNRTRFQTPDGNIYRLTGKQVIPAARKVGGDIIPGKKDVKVEADEVGIAYNIKKGAKLSIPGLSKDKDFKNSYAIVKSNIVGGFSGEKFIPNEEEERMVRERLRYEIETELRANLAKILETNSFSEMVVFDNAIFITYNTLENEQTENGVNIREEGILRSIEFREIEFASLLAGSIDNSPLAGVTPKRIDTKEISIEIDIENEDIDSIKEFSFRINGKGTIYWDVDEVLLLSDLAGKKKSNISDNILKTYPQILSVDKVSVFPLWRSTFPGNKNKINIVTMYKMLGE